MSVRISTVKVVTVLCALLVAIVGLGAVGAKSAQAAPETPVAEAPYEVMATSATLRGAVDPGKEGGPGEFELGSYKFVYRATSSSQCRGAGEVSTPMGMSLGAGKEEVFQYIEALAPRTAYAVCLVVENALGTEEATSQPVSFKTVSPPETPVNEEVAEITPTSATLKATLNPNAPAEPGFFRFFYSISQTECRGTETEQASELGESLGSEGEVVQEQITELRPGTVYTACIVARNEAGEAAEGAPITFATPTAAPEIAGESAKPENGTEVILTAAIAPGGLSTTYGFEYLQATQFKAQGWEGATRLPVEREDELPASSVIQEVRAHGAGLEPETPYLYRITARNERGLAVGAVSEFTTGLREDTGELPDARVYELVSTDGSIGEPYSPTSFTYGFAAHSDQLFEAAEDGESVTYMGEPSPAGGNGNVGSGEGNQWLAKRGASGWATNVITPERSEVGTNFPAFTNELASGIVETKVQPPLSSGAQAGCDELYRRSSATGAFTAIVTATQTPGECGKPLFAGETSSGETVIFQSEAALVSPADPATELPPGRSEHNGGAGQENGEGCDFGCNLYAVTDGHTQLVNVLPGSPGATVPNASFGGYESGTSAKTDLSNAISQNGAEIFWTDTQPGPQFEHIYVLEHGTIEQQISGSEPAQYWAASPDGLYAFYTENGALWRFDTASNTRQLLLDEEAKVKAVVADNSEGEDGAYVYVVANGALNEEENSSGAKAIAEEPNLYLLHDQKVSFIATLSTLDNEARADEGDSGSDVFGDWAPDVGDRTIEATPSGQQLVFASIRPLTGYANENFVSEVFRFNANTGILNCASCDPRGLPASSLGEARDAPLPVSSQNNVYIRRWMSADGSRIFFDSTEQLVSSDKNEVQDVYEWEEEGTGSCTPAAPQLVDRGCIYLLSGGDSDDMSFLVDADREGNNVFFTHRGALGPISISADQNALYDARIDGGFVHTGSGCTVAICRSEAVSVVPSPMPASMGVSGASNFPLHSVAAPKETVGQRLAAALKSCRKTYKKRKRRIACERAARKKLAPKASKKTSKAFATKRQGR